MLQNQIRAAVAKVLGELAVDGVYGRYTSEYSEQLVAALASRVSASEVLLTSSGTAAVELALRAGGVGLGDEVLLAAYDYPGNFWAVERVGARPVLVDVEAGGWRIDCNQLLAASQSGELANCRALIVSHLHGQLQDVARLRAWCDEQGLLLIEDACQALGATIAGRPAGSFGHASILSFGGGKILSAGRGGALATSDAKFAHRARVAAGAGSGPYALSELQAAVVGAQLGWLDQIIAQSRLFFGDLCQGLHIANSTIAVPYAGQLYETSFYQGGLLVDPHRSNATDPGPQSSLIEQLYSSGIPAGVGFTGFHRRSSRRCRCLQPLVCTAKIVDQTITVHHRIALAGVLTGTQAARIIDGLNAT